MKTFTLDPKNPPTLSKAQLKRLDAMKDEDIDYSDIPDLSEDAEFWKNAKLVDYPPKKVSFTTRVDADVLEWFRAQGKGYQTQINAILRTYMKAHT